MTKKIFAAMFALLAFLAVMPAPYSLAEEDTLTLTGIQTIDGIISGIDSEKEIITVHWMADEVMMKYQDITLKVLPATSITKNAEPLELDDIENGDHVTVRYDPNGVPLPSAASVAVWET